MAKILSADEVEALLKDDIYIYKNKEYCFLSEVVNKTNNTIMVLYRDTNDNYYVRDKEDFFNKFIEKGE